MCTMVVSRHKFVVYSLTLAVLSTTGTVLLLRLYDRLSTAGVESILVNELNLGFADNSVSNLMADENPVQDRRAYVERLARSGAEVEIILLLTDRSFLTPLDASEFSYQTKPEDSGHRAEAQNAIIAALIDAIPAEAGWRTQWALTTRLDDHGVGSYSESRRSGWSRANLHFSTDEIREHARRTLVRILGRDFGYDIVLWRKEIVLQATQKTDNYGVHDE